MSANHAEIREALAAGPTDGPWTRWHGEVHCGPVVKVGRAILQGSRGRIAECEDDEIDDEQAKANAQFIAACHPTAIHALLNERDELRQASIAWGRQMHTLMDERDELRQALERIADDGIERSRDPRTLIAVSEAMVKAAMDAYMNEASNVSYAGIRAALVAAMEVRHG